jgi:hypothetical protein
MIRSLALLVLISAIPFGTIAQKYENYTKVDGVQLSTKWVPASKFKKNSPLQLLIKAENKNAFEVELALSVALYLDGILEEQSGISELTLRAGKSLQGKLNGLFFESDRLSNEQIKSDKFEFEILDLKVVAKD